MIYMSINTHDFENDVRVMTGAFYPGEKIVTEYNENCRMTVSIMVTADTIIGRVEYSGQSVVSFTIDVKKDRKSTRDCLKRKLYSAFSEHEGKELPWGTLTGIRPVKIPLSQIEQGKTDDFIINYMQSEYLVNRKKAELSLSVAKNEHHILKNIDYSNGYSLYVGIPFCPTTCLYCSFTSYPLSMWKNRIDDYLDALIKELTYLSELLKGRKADSIYIGGGTPTTLLPYQFDRLLSFIEERFDISSIREFTVEAGRPDSIDKDKLMMLRMHNIDRISINPQTMNQKTLDIIGRRHTVTQIYDAYGLARECGFNNINMDLIVGLPGEDKEDVKHTMEAVMELSPDNLTVHSLAIKRAARLNTEKELYSDYHIENTDEIIDMTHGYAIEMGLNPYYLYRQKNMAGNFENVGYAKPGMEGIYNILIMEEKQSIFAAGANSQSKIVTYNPYRVDRIENVKEVSEYIDRVDEMIDRKRRYFNGN